MLVSLKNKKKYAIVFALIIILVVGAILFFVVPIKKFKPSGYRDTLQWERVITGENSKEITDKHHEAAKKYIEKKKKECFWENAFFIGDSVTYGTVSENGDARIAKVTYPQQVCENLSIDSFEANGVGGSSFCIRGMEWFLGREKDFPEKADVIFVLGGYNDAFNPTNCIPGDADTPGTVTGDIELLFDCFDEKYPDADVFVIIPYKIIVGDVVWKLANQENLEKINGIVRERASAHGYYIIDLYDSGFLDITDGTCREDYYSDSIHLSDAGYKLLGDMIVAEALRLKTGSWDGREGY